MKWSEVKSIVDRLSAEQLVLDVKAIIEPSAVSPPPSYDALIRPPANTLGAPEIVVQKT